MAARAIPVTTIGGYLGAGKTTLVNAILGGSHGRRIGVLVNDFGAVSIDEKLIVSREGDVIALANGCACCSVAGDLGEALDRLATIGGPEHILVEASGVAHPGKIAALARSPGLAPRAPVVLADATDIVARADDKFVGKLVRRQLSEAGLLVLTKADKVPPERLASARRFVATLTGAETLESRLGDVDASLLLAERPTSIATIFVCAPPDDADPSFASHVWSNGSPLDPDRLREAFENLPEAVVRAKGVFTAPDGVAFAIHRAGAQIDVERIDRPSDRAAHIVVISMKGRLDAAILYAALEKCVAIGPRQ